MFLCYKTLCRNSFFDMLTAGRLTTLLGLSGVEGSNAEGQIRNSNDRKTKAGANAISEKRWLF
jgi:hypothetical protein